jgi:hypothetical protein
MNEDQFVKLRKPIKSRHVACRLYTAYAWLVPGVWAGRWRFHHGAPTGHGHACDMHTNVRMVQ